MNTHIKFDVFDFLEMEHKQITRALESLLSTYRELKNEERMDAVRRIFRAIERYFECQEVLMLTVGDLDLPVDLPSRLSSRGRIVDLLDDMVMEHVDDYSFYANLRLLMRLLENEEKEEAADLYTRVKECTGEALMKRLEETLASEILLSQ